MVSSYTAYLDQGIYSKLRNVEHAWLGEKLIEFGALPVFSDVHLTEMQNSGRPDDFANVLDKLDARYLRYPNFDRDHYHPIACIDAGSAKHRLLEHHANFENGLKVSLPLLHKMLGGQKDKQLSEIVSDSSEQLKKLVGCLFDEVGFIPPPTELAKLNATVEKTKEYLSQWDLDRDLKRATDQRKAARDGDRLRDKEPVERVEFLISLLEDHEKAGFYSKFPRHFARNRLLKSGEVTGFAFTLYALGMVHDPKLYKGKTQSKKFRAQFRDCCHIEEASRCDLFLTADQGAFDLAAATFAYCGFPTKAAFLNFSKAH